MSPMTSILQQVDAILAKRRQFEKNAGFSDPLNRDVIKNFSHFQDIVDSTLRAIPLFDGLKTEESDDTGAEFIIKSTIAFNLRFYDSLTTKVVDLDLFSCESGRKSELDLLFLLLWKQSIFSLTSAFLLTKNSLYFQAMQILRGYIESSAVLYLSLVDKEFFAKYSSNDVTREEYMVLWFKELKPSKVTRKIRSIHTEWSRIDKADGVMHIGARSLPEDIFTSGLIKNVYDETSDFVHFNRYALLSSSAGDEFGQFYIGLKEEGKRCQNDMYIVMANLFPFLSGLIEMLISSNPPIIEYNKMMGDFSCLINEMRLNSIN